MEEGCGVAVVRLEPVGGVVERVERSDVQQQLHPCDDAQSIGVRVGVWGEDDDLFGVEDLAFDSRDDPHPIRNGLSTTVTAVGGLAG